MDIFEEDIELINTYYDKDNYRVEEIDKNKKKCLICFSSHATYYPFTKEAFIERIVYQDRYEFENIVHEKKIRSEFGKIIYVRDLWREWYVRGINSRENSIDKIIEKIAELTKGYQIITIGNSSGGYLATIVGIRLRAEIIYNFSGQYSLEQWKGRKWLSKYSTDEEKSKYYNIVNMVEKSTVPIVYCYPGKAVDDVKQAELVRNCDNVISFAFDSDKHGQTVVPYNYKYLFGKNVEKHKKLSEKLSGKLIKAPIFLILTGGISGGMDCIRGMIYLLCTRNKKRNKGNGQVL